MCYILLWISLVFTLADRGRSGRAPVPRFGGSSVQFRSSTINFGPYISNFSSKKSILTSLGITLAYRVESNTDKVKRTEKFTSWDWNKYIQYLTPLISPFKRYISFVKILVKCFWCPLQPNPGSTSDLGHKQKWKENSLFPVVFYVDWLTRNDNEHFLLFQTSKAKIDPYIDLKTYRTLYTNKTQPSLWQHRYVLENSDYKKSQHTFAGGGEENNAGIDKAISYED